MNTYVTVTMNPSTTDASSLFYAWCNGKGRLMKSKSKQPRTVRVVSRAEMPFQAGDQLMYDAGQRYVYGSSIT
jgi:hypothetical protein